MMRASRSVGSVLSLVLPVGIAAAVTGCQTEPPPAPPAPVKPAATPMYTQTSEVVLLPGAKLVFVDSVTTETKKLALSLYKGDATDVKPGDVFTFTDRGENVIANGSVTSVTSTADNHTFVMVQYKVVAGARNPAIGDYAFRQPK